MYYLRHFTTIPGFWIEVLVTLVVGYSQGVYVIKLIMEDVIYNVWKNDNVHTASAMGKMISLWTVNPAFRTQHWNYLLLVSHSNVQYSIFMLHDLYTSTEIIIVIIYPMYYNFISHNKFHVIISRVSLLGC